MKEALNPLQASTPVHLLMQAGVFDVWSPRRELAIRAQRPPREEYLSSTHICSSSAHSKIPASAPPRNWGDFTKLHSSPRVAPWVTSAGWAWTWASYDVSIADTAAALVTKTAAAREEVEYTERRMILSEWIGDCIRLRVAKDDVCDRKENQMLMLDASFWNSSIGINGWVDGWMSWISCEVSFQTNYLWKRSNFLRWFSYHLAPTPSSSSLSLLGTPLEFLFQWHLHRRGGWYSRREGEHTCYFLII